MNFAGLVNWDFESIFFYFADRDAAHRRSNQHGQKDEEQVVADLQNKGLRVIPVKSD